MGINCFDGGCHRRKQHRQNPSEEGHHHSSSSLFQVQGIFLFSQFHIFSPFSYAHDFLSLQNLTFDHNYSILNIRMCFSLMWMYVNPKTFNLSVFFLCTCTCVCMNVGFWVKDILPKIPFFIEERVTRKSLFD